MGKRPARLLPHGQCTLFSAISAARSSGTEQDKSTHEKACQIQSAIQDPSRQGRCRKLGAPNRKPGQVAKARKAKTRVLKSRTPPQKRRPDRRSAEDRLAELKRRLLEISDLGAVGSVLGWDEATYMPTGGAAARGRQSATLSRMRHERSIDPALGRLIDSLAPYAEGLPPDSDDAALIRVARRDFGKAIKVPAEWVERASGTARRPTMPGRGRGPPTTSRPCGRISRRRSSFPANMPASSRPTTASPIR